MKTTSLLAVMFFAISAAPGLAQTDLEETVAPSHFIDLETVQTLPRHAFGIRTEARGFGGHEDNAYVGVGLRLGLADGLEGIVRGVLADRRDAAIGGGAAIRHGGNDFEALLKYRPSGLGIKNLAGMIGVCLPDTPAQSQAILTLGAVGSHTLSDRVELTVNPRAIFIRDNTIVGIGLGASARIGNGCGIAVEYTPIVSGDNTRSMATGDRIRRDVYGVALHFMSRGSSTDWAVGYTNALGNTTGYSLTPALGGSGGFFFSISMRK